MTTILTRSKAFGRLTKWAFRVCANKDGLIGREELYSGILLCHLNLAKYCGAAACYPPRRVIVDELFDGADEDKSGFIDEKEFEEIVRVCSKDILRRIIVYYSIIILLVPYLTPLLLDGLTIQNTWLDKYITVKQVAEGALGCLFLFLLIPFFFDYIDHTSRQEAGRKSS